MYVYHINFYSNFLAPLIYNDSKYDNADKENDAEIESLKTKFRMRITLEFGFVMLYLCINMIFAFYQILGAYYIFSNIFFNN